MRTMWATVALLTAAGVASASPVPINFVRTSNNAPNTVNDKFVITVDQASATSAVFRFARVGTGSVAIGVIWFDDANSLFSGESFTGSAGVSYGTSPPPGPANPPDLNTPFNVSWDYFRTNNGGISNAVNANGEWFDVTLTFAGGTTYAQVLNGLNNGGLRIAMHLQSIPGGYSDTYLSTNVVPLPPAVWSAMGGLLLAGGAVAVRKRQRR